MTVDNNTITVDLKNDIYGGKNAKGGINPICDFCGEDNPVWEYSCKDFKQFITNKIYMDYRGAWCACEVCKDLIETEKLDELSERAVDEALKFRGEKIESGVRKTLLKSMKETHIKFYNNKVELHKCVKVN